MIYNNMINHLHRIYSGHKYVSQTAPAFSLNDGTAEFRTNDGTVFHKNYCIGPFYTRPPCRPPPHYIYIFKIWRFYRIF